jgi:hypothetical protein
VRTQAARARGSPRSGGQGGNPTLAAATVTSANPPRGGGSDQGGSRCVAAVGGPRRARPDAARPGTAVAGADRRQVGDRVGDWRRLDRDQARRRTTGPPRMHSTPGAHARAGPTCGSNGGPPQPAALVPRAPSA